MTGVKTRHRLSFRLAVLLVSKQTTPDALSILITCLIACLSIPVFNGHSLFIPGDFYLATKWGAIILITLHPQPKRGLSSPERLIRDRDGH